MGMLSRVAKGAGILGVVGTAAMLSPGGEARADLVPTDRTAGGEIAAQRQQVRDFLVREDVMAEMQALGVSPEEAAERVDSLSAAELQQIAGKLDTLPAGQGILLVAILVIVILVLVL